MARSDQLSLRVLPTRITVHAPGAKASVEIYRPYFLAGIAAVLTAGCLLGAIALFGIAQAKSYTASAWTPYILAHANSQLFGWVAFFVMGFALQHHAPSNHRLRLFHGLAWISLGLMAVGIAMRFVAEPTGSVPLGLIACCSQLVAVLLFMGNVAFTRHRGSERLEWPGWFVLTSLGWMVLVSVAEPFVFVGSHQANSQASISFVAEWFVPLREAQFLGFVAMMIFGVSFTKFSSCFGAQPADKSLGLSAYGWWMTGLALRIGGWLWAFSSGLQGPGLFVYFCGGVCLAIGAFNAAVACRIFAKLSFSLPSHKFMRAAYGWLLVAGLMLLAEPFVLSLLGQPFSHAYTGAIRHAVTVGFISQMIMGVGYRVASRMNGLDESGLNPLWVTFWLLNAGNATRVLAEVATDFTPAAFAPMGITGFVELTAIVFWGASMVRLMRQRALVTEAA